MNQAPQGIPPELEETLAAVRIVAGQLFGYTGTSPIKEWFGKLTDEQKFRAFSLQHEAAKDRFNPNNVPEGKRIAEISRRFDNNLKAIVASTLAHGSSPEEQAIIKKQITIKLAQMIINNQDG